MMETEQIPQAVVEREPTQETQEPRRSHRVCHEPERFSFLMTQEGEMVLMDDEPNSYEETMMGPDSKKWLEAMRTKMDSMHSN